jgi:hypothetical protein
MINVGASVPSNHIEKGNYKGADKFEEIKNVERPALESISPGISDYIAMEGARPTDRCQETGYGVKN